MSLPLSILLGGIMLIKKIKTYKEKRETEEDLKSHHHHILNLVDIIGHSDDKVAGIKLLDIGIRKGLDLAKSVFTKVRRHSLSNIGCKRYIDPTCN